MGLCGNGKVNSVWDLKTCQRIAGHVRIPRANARILDFHPDSTTLFAAQGGGARGATRESTSTTCESGTSPASRPASRVFELPHNLSEATFSPDGSVLLTTCHDGLVRIWKTPHPIKETPDLIEAWIEELTGIRLDDRNIPEFLDRPGLNERQTKTAGSEKLRQLRMNFAAP